MKGRPPEDNRERPPLDAQLDQLLDQLFANASTTLADPFVGWNELRSRAPVYNYRSAILASSHKAARTVLLDKERFSGAWLNHGDYMAQFRLQLSERELLALDELLRFEQYFMRFHEEPEHARLRGIVQHAFLPRQIAVRREPIRAYCEGLLDAWSGSAVVDFMEFAYRLPLHVICEMIGIPPSDEDMVHEWSGAFVGASMKQHSASIIPAYNAMVSWRDYMRTIFREHRVRGTEAVLLNCLFAAIDCGELDEEGATAFCINMLFGGHEGPTNLLSIGLFELMRNREQWQALCEDPSRIAHGVEELLRFVSPNEWERRVALVDTVLLDVPIRAGQTVFPILAAANRDPAVFPDPDRLNLGRINANEHLAFSFGIHHCLGAVLARLEASVALNALTARFPNVSLAIENIDWINVGDRRRIERLPLQIVPSV